MKDKHLLLYKEHNVFRGVAFYGQDAEDAFAADTIRLFGVNFVQLGAFCEWEAVVAIPDRRIIGFCLTDFYRDMPDPVVLGLQATNVIATKHGLIVLLESGRRWEKVHGPYLPAIAMRSDAGIYSYIIPSAFNHEDVLPVGLTTVTDLSQIAESIPP